MIEPIDADPTPWEAQADRERDSDEERRLQRREQNRRYRESHPEQNAATRHKWVDANRDRVREYNRQWRADNLERAHELNRESARRAVLRAKRQAELRAKARERAKRWRQSHLDAVRIYQAHWVEQNREKVRGYYNDYYRAHREEIGERAAARRDADPESMKRARKAWAERNRDRLAELQRTRRSDPNVYQAQLEANAAARRLKRRLQSAGLPPKNLHVVTAAERRANQQEAARYFGDPELPERIWQSDVFTEALTKHLREHQTQMRELVAAYCGARRRAGLPDVPMDDVIYARAVDIVLTDMRRTNLLTSKDIARAVRSARATLLLERREQQSIGLLKALVDHAKDQRARLGEDVELENRARVRRGLPPVQVEALLVDLALREVVVRVPTNHLSRSEVRAICRAAKLRVSILVDNYSSEVLPVSVHESASPRVLG